MYFDHICNWIISTHKIRSISCPTPTPILSSLVQFWQYIFKPEIPDWWWCLCSLPQVSGVVWSKLGCPPFAPSPYQPPCPAWDTDTGVLSHSSNKEKSAHLIRGTRLLSSSKRKEKKAWIFILLLLVLVYCFSHHFSLAFLYIFLSASLPKYV